MKRGLEDILVGGTISLVFMAGTAFYHALFVVAIVKIFRHFFG